MHNISLAMQRAVVEYTSPTDIEIRAGLRSLQQIVRPTDPEALRLCGMVKIWSAEHTSFSVLGLVLMLVLGSGFIVLGFVLARAVGWARTKTGWRLYKRRSGLTRALCSCRGRRWKGAGSGLGLVQTMMFLSWPDIGGPFPQRRMGVQHRLGLQQCQEERNWVCLGARLCLESYVDIE